MRTLIFTLTTFALLTACSTDKCKKPILDLVIKSHDDPNNKIVDYYKTQDFIDIVDTNQLLRFAKPDEISFYFQPSELDPTKRKYSYKAKEGVIKTTNYQVDILLRTNNDKNGQDYLYWLKSYDNNRNQIGQIDFAAWYKEGFYSCGRLDCDSTIHMLSDNGKQERIFKIDATGKFIYLKNDKE